MSPKPLPGGSVGWRELRSNWTGLTRKMPTLQNAEYDIKTRFRDGTRVGGRGVGGGGGEREGWQLSSTCSKLREMWKQEQDMVYVTLPP